MRFEGKTMLVTGGTSGIGLATAQRLLEDGARVAITGSREASITSAKRQLGDVLALDNDAGGIDAGDALAAAIEREWGGLDGAFLNAGVGTFTPLEHCGADQFDAEYYVNVRGPMLQARALVPLMPAGSALVFNTSIAWHTGLENAAIYASSKAAVRAMTRVLSRELAPKGIRVNAVAPGAIGTNFFARSGLTESDMEQISESFLGQVPLGRWGEPAEVASVACFLLSPDASYVTGSEYVVDGGFSQA